MAATVTGTGSAGGRGGRTTVSGIALRGGERRPTLFVDNYIERNQRTCCSPSQVVGTYGTFMKRLYSSPPLCPGRGHWPCRHSRRRRVRTRHTSWQVCYVCSNNHSLRVPIDTWIEGNGSPFPSLVPAASVVPTVPNTPPFRLAPMFSFKPRYELKRCMFTFVVCLPSAFALKFSSELPSSWT